MWVWWVSVCYVNGLFVYYNGWDDVGVMKDKEMKFEDVKTPHSLGWVSYNYSYTSIPPKKS